MSDSEPKAKANASETISPSENNTQQNVSIDVHSQEDEKIKPSLSRDEAIQSHLTELVDNFDQLNLREPLLRGIYGYGLEHPSDVQKRTLKPCISGYDVVVQAQSGTGKTITYIIAILQKLDLNCKDCQVLILVSARELAQGIHKVVLSLGEFLNVTCHAILGGVNIREDIKRFEAGIQVVVSTPGRAYDMLKRSAFRSENIKMVVLDEADELLSRRFKDQIYDIFQMLPKNFQFILLSSTMPCDVLEIVAKFMNDPVKILIKREERTLEGIRQFYVKVDREEWKLDTLYDLFDTLTIVQTVILCNTCQKIDWLAENLRTHNLTVSVLTPHMDVKQRDDVIKEFRTGSSRILIRTDMSEIDRNISHVSLIINYDLPTNREHYIQRIGRSGAFGRKGVAINFITKDEQQALRHIEQFYNTQIEELPVDISDLI